VNFPKRGHKNLSIALLACLPSLAGSISGGGPQSSQVNRELKMNVHLDAAAVGESKVPKFRVELQNAGEDDLILNLGITLANGRKQYPKDIVLLLTVCFATILSALKIARFPAATAVPSRLSLHPRAPRISPGRTPARYTCIY
jgi:hypothetical protein